MKRRTISSLLIVLIIFTVALVGASLLDLTGSDTAPGEGKTEAACANHLVVKHPVANLGHDLNSVPAIHVNGDLSNCRNQTIKLEVDLDGVNHAYSFRRIGENVSSLSFIFDQTNGDFTNAAPIPVNGELTRAGTLVGPPLAKNFGLVTVTIASNWS
jgi:hypothetical protein